MPRRIIEIILLSLLFALFAGQLPPDVNESHYLTKAKHGWDPAWCSGDLFLSSSFSHWLFYLTFGWLNQFLSLTHVAWIGRLTTWVLMAIAWQRLSEIVLKTPWLSIVAAAFFLILNERFHLAGEWVVGGFEAKGLAYCFVLLALGSLAKKQYRWLWPQLGLACSFHVLVGGWATLASIFAITVSSKRLSSSIRISSIKNISPLDRLTKYWLPITLGGSFALIGILPPLLSDFSANPDAKSFANYIYVVERISHHLSFGAFSAARVACFAIILFAFAAVGHFSKRLPSPSQARWSPIYNFALGSLGISFAGLILSGISESDGRLAGFCTGLLRFYWFRLADFAVPLALSFGCLILVQQNYRIGPTNDPISFQRMRKISSLAFVAAIAMATSLLIFDRHADPRPRADRAALPSYPDDPTRTRQTYENWIRVCQWIESNTPNDSVFITPDQQQTFKWYAQRTEVVNWKDVPQDAQSMLDWRRRVALFIEPQRQYPQGLFAYSDEQLIESAHQFGATHLLLPQQTADMVRVSDQLRQVYPANPATKATYVVFEIPIKQ
jgi:hypothetical protein